MVTSFGFDSPPKRSNIRASVNPMHLATVAKTSQIFAPLDPGFLPPVLWNRQYIADVKVSGRGVPLVLGLERENGLVSRCETTVDRNGGPQTLRYVERLVKFLLWARGGWKLYVGGPRAIGDFLKGQYSTRGKRAFDVDMMTRAYAQPFRVVVCNAGKVPAAREPDQSAGGHLRGCRIGFDLGASDYKVAAVIDGEAVFTEEVPWDPKSKSDPDYHFHHVASALHRAAAHLPRVDAIGGSSAGVIVDNEIRIASLLRAIPRQRYAEAAKLFKRLQKLWNVPMVVMNDGDVTALAGALSLRRKGMLGIAMGSSEAAGFIDRQGCIRGWLNELAFAPVDYNPKAPPDEWSKDRGVGAMYFSQQAVNKLLPAAKIGVPPEMGLPERLKAVQDLMKKGDTRAAKIYETIGVYLGYSLPYYLEFYDCQNVLLLGRVTTGQGGDLLLARARKVLQAEFPEVARRLKLEVPDEKSRRVGQAVAAASLPQVPH